MKTQRKGVCAALIQEKEKKQCLATPYLHQDGKAFG